MDGQASLKIYAGEKELEDDKVSIKDIATVDNADISVEIDVVLKVSIEVHGKGKDYSVTIDVQ